MNVEAGRSPTPYPGPRDTPGPAGASGRARRAAGWCALLVETPRKAAAAMVQRRGGPGARYPPGSPRVQGRCKASTEPPTVWPCRPRPAGLRQVVGRFAGRGPYRNRGVTVGRSGVRHHVWSAAGQALGPPAEEAEAAGAEVRALAERGPAWRRAGVRAAARMREARTNATRDSGRRLVSDIPGGPFAGQQAFPSSHRRCRSHAR